MGQFGFIIFCIVILMIHPYQQLNLAKTYFDTLPATDLSKKYSEATKPITFGFWDRTKLLCNIEGYYSELLKFYPYHNVVKASAESYREEVSGAIKNGLALSAISVFAIFQFARRGQVAPVLRKYGRFFNTHRVFRQYIWAWVLPTTLLWTIADFNHIDNVEQLWKVHSRRMQAHVYTDPAGTEYPEHLLPKSHVCLWDNVYTVSRDLEAKLANEVALSQAPEYTNPEFEAVDFGEADVEDEQ